MSFDSDHGSLPLTHWCCSIRLLRSMSMCLARSQLSLVREVCPRLRDSNLPTESQSDTSHSNTSQLEEIITQNTVITFLLLSISGISLLVIMTYCCVYLTLQPIKE